MAFLLWAVFVVLLVPLLLIIRLYCVVKSGSNYKPGSKGPVSVLVVAGSGGHTSEILRLLGGLCASYAPRHYVLADSDRMSEDKIRSFEGSGQQTEPQQAQPQFTIRRVPRSREVRQSWGSSVLSSLHALLYSIPLVFSLGPDMVLCNGPGTCVPLCLAALLLGIVGKKKVVLVYVESICRVQSLSLTGRILYPMSDYFFVQWAPLRDKYPKSIYLGKLV